MAGQPFVLASVFAFAVSFSLAQQHRAARLELLRELGDGLAGACDVLAMRFGGLGRMIDLGRAVADRDDEM